MTLERFALRGRAAAPGLAGGPPRTIADGVRRKSARPVRRRSSAARFSHAIEAALPKSSRRSPPPHRGEAAEILEFQLALLEDEDLSAPALADIGNGASAVQRLGTARSARRSPTIRSPKTSTFALARPILPTFATGSPVSLDGGDAPLGPCPRRRSSSPRTSRPRASSKSTGRGRQASLSPPAARRAMSRCWRARAACRWSWAWGRFRPPTALGRYSTASRARSRSRRRRRVLADWRAIAAAQAETPRQRGGPRLQARASLAPAAGSRR